jgi:hypothetical protein
MGGVLWRQAHELLVNAEERGWPGNTRLVWCSAPDNVNLSTSRRGPNLTLRCHFPAGSPAGKVYTELVSRPGLSAIVVLIVRLTTFWASSSATAGWRLNCRSSPTGSSPTLSSFSCGGLSIEYPRWRLKRP